LNEEIKGILDSKEYCTIGQNPAFYADYAQIAKLMNNAATENNYLAKATHKLLSMVSRLFRNFLLLCRETSEIYDVTEIRNTKLIEDFKIKKKIGNLKTDDENFWNSPKYKNIKQKIRLASKNQLNTFDNDTKSKYLLKNFIKKIDSNYDLLHGPEMYLMTQKNNLKLILERKYGCIIRSKTDKEGNPNLFISLNKLVDAVLEKGDDDQFVSEMN